MILAQGALAVPTFPGLPDVGWAFDDGSGNTATAIAGTDATIGGTEGVDFIWSTDTMFPGDGHSIRMIAHPGYGIDMGQPALPKGANAVSDFTLSLRLNVPPVGANWDSIISDITSSDGSTVDRGSFIFNSSGNTGVGTNYRIGQVGVWHADGAFYNTADTGVDITGGVWHHLAFISENEGAAMQIYVDGVQVLSTNYASQSGGFTQAYDSSCIADSGCPNHPGGTGDHYLRFIDEPMFYYRALTFDEIGWLATNPIGSAPPIPEPASLALVGLGGLLLLRRRRRA